MSLQQAITLAQGGPPSDPEQALLTFLLRELPAGYSLRSSVALYEASGAAFEIDLVILGHHGVYVVDVKGWGGRISASDQRWMITPPGGPARTVSDPLAMTFQKARLLALLLEQEMGTARPWIEAVVVVTDPDVEISLPPSVRAHVLTPRELVRAVQLGDLPGQPLPAGREPVSEATAASVAHILEGIRPRPRPGLGRLRDEAALIVRDLVLDLRAQDHPADLHGALWWLVCAFVRALEERGLITNRIAGKGAPEAETAFFAAHPTGSATGYLRHVLGDVAAYPVGDAVLGDLLGELEDSPLSHDAARALLAFFRQSGRPGKQRWTFAGDPWTDLYQGMSTVLQREHGMVATPSFVAASLLDQTLARALNELGPETTRVLDPACGSGLLLHSAFEKIHDRLGAIRPALDGATLAGEALDKVHGVDISPLSVLVTRIRLVLAYLERTGVQNLVGALRPPLHVAVADALLAGNGVRSSKDRNQDILGRRYEVVVCEAPGVTCKDPAQRELYRRQYRSAFRTFSLAAPFIERCFQLAAPGGFVGVFAPSSFMKRQFGKPLVEEVLPTVDLTRVVDASGAFIPGHGVPMLLLFGRNRPPRSEPVRIVGAKRGEPMVPHDPATGEVWSTIVAHLDDAGYEDDYIWVADVPRSGLAKHPWALGGGARASVKDAFEQGSSQRLRDIAASIRVGASSGRDEVFVLPRGAALRLNLEGEVLRPCLSGDSLGDWATHTDLCALTPYDANGAESLPRDPEARWWRYLWRYRVVLQARAWMGRSHPEPWWAWSRWPGGPPRAVPRLLCRSVASSNHFVLNRGDGVVRASVMSIEMPSPVSEGDCLALLAYLNSSAVCFWLKQTSSQKGAPAGDTFAGAGVFDFGARVGDIPVPSRVLEPGPLRTDLVAAARRLDLAAQEREDSGPERVLARWDHTSRDELLDALGESQMREIASLRAMVACQEEIDWLVYEALGLTATAPRAASGSALPEQRPFAWLSEEPPAGLDQHLVAPWRRRRETLRSEPMVQVLEDRAFKRPFRELAMPPGIVVDEEEGATRALSASGPRVPRGRAFRERIVTACETWLLDRIEKLFRNLDPARPMSAEEITSRLAASVDVGAVSALLHDLAGEIPLAVTLRSLLETNAVPFAAAFRHTEAGRAKRADWERTWESQRREEAGEQVTHSVPPTYNAEDYRDSVTWLHRGRLDVPTERFIRYPGAAPDGVAEMYGWAGWSTEGRLTAITALVAERSSRDQWDQARLEPLLAGISELADDAPSPAGRLADIGLLAAYVPGNSHLSIPSPGRQKIKGTLA